MNNYNTKVFVRTIYCLTHNPFVWSPSEYLFLSFHPKRLTICVFFSTPITLGGRLLSIFYSPVPVHPQTR